jgi:TonB-linked SusC/RagA family outer membrane protein
LRQFIKKVDILFISMEEKNHFGTRKFGLSFLLFFLTSYLTIFGQIPLLRGRVTDTQNIPLVGVNVVEKGTSNGTVTDMDGNYSLKVSADATIVFSYIGFQNQEVKWNGENPLDIVMQEDSELLSEVVVVGYGTQRKINLSGAVDQIGIKELEAKPITNLSQGLQGMIPNLNIDFTSGEPGKTARINIRGITSINGGNPLILIDGIPSSPEELDRLLPGDIAGISVLKDAASAAVYGARAAFGVILITTKTGKSEKIHVDYNNNFTWERPSILPDKTSDPYIYLKLKNIAVLNTPWSGGHVASDERLEWARQRSDDPSSSEPVRLNPLDQTQWEYMGNQDWTKYFLDKYTFSNSHQVSVSGHAGKTTFYLSGGMDDENGILSDIVDDDNYQRYNFRIKGSYDITEWFTLSNNTWYVSTERIKPGYFWDSHMGMFYNLAPQDYDRNPDGTWANNEAGRTLARLNDGGDDIRKYDKIQNTFGAELNFLKKQLKINANYSFVKGTEDYNWFQTKYLIGYGPNDIREEGNSSAYRTYTTDYYNVIDIFGTLNLTKNRHYFTTVLGYNQEYSRYNWLEAQREGLISNQLPTVTLATGDQKVNESYRDWAVRGLFYRLNYIYNEKYIVELNGRYDGSSRFPEKKRFGFFPSVSLAWRIDSEPFFEPLREGIDNLKLRVSYGSLGNQLVSEYGYIPTMNSSLGWYLIDGKRQQTVSAPPLVSSNYTWETVTTQNIGIDLNLLDNKLGLVADLFRRDTKGMLVQGKELPAVLGAPAPKENAANMKTTGWELTLTYNDHFIVKNKPLNMSAKLLISDTRSWITKFDNPNNLLTQYYVGQELGEIWGLQSDGLFSTEEEIAKLDESEIIPWGSLEIVPGWPKYKDLNGDNRITKGLTKDDPKDLSIIGNNSPRFRYGFNLAGDWNNFDFSIFLQGIGKRDYYPQSYLYWSFYQQPYAGGQTHIFDFYRPQTDSEVDMAKHSKAYITAGLANQNLDAKYPVLQSWLADKNLGLRIDESMGLAIPQTKYLLSGAYLRIKNITLGYTLPKTLSDKIKLNRIRLFVSGDNIFEWSEVRQYFDPEAITDESNFGYVYPFNRQYIVGLNVTF